MLRPVHTFVVFLRFQVGDDFGGEIEAFRKTFLDLGGDAVCLADWRRVRK